MISGLIRIQNSEKSSDNSLIKAEFDNVSEQRSSRNAEQDLSYQGSILFCTWSEYEAGDFQIAKARQHLQARYALYSSGSAGGIQSLASAKTVEGTVFIIETPSSFKGDIPKDCILVSPYFDNRCVICIHMLKGIAFSRGSRLSHSAIVAREYNVPYGAISDLNLESLEQGLFISGSLKALSLPGDCVVAGQLIFLERCIQRFLFELSEFFWIRYGQIPNIHIKRSYFERALSL